MQLEANRIWLVKKLLENGADPNQPNKMGMTPLLVAAARGTSVVAKILLDHGANPNLGDPTPLLAAISIKNAEMVKMLIDHGANPNLGNMRTPLLEAVFSGNTEIVKMLLDRGANPNLKDINGYTPLLLAASEGNLEIMKILLNHGVNLDSVNKNGTSALYCAAQNGHKDCVEILLEHGANANIPMMANVSVLQKHAEKTEYSAQVKNLLSKCEKSFYSQLRTFAGQPDQLPGFTSLHAAAFFGHKEVVAMLLDKGADLNSRASGITPLDFARAMNHRDIVELLESRQTKAQKPQMRPRS